MAEAGQNGGGFFQGLKKIITGQSQTPQKTETKATQVPQTPQEWDTVFEKKEVASRPHQSPDEIIQGARIEAQQEEGRLARMKAEAEEKLAKHPTAEHPNKDN